MLKLEDENGTPVQRRTAVYSPRQSWRTWLIGRPLQTADAENQTVRKIVGLAVFASDALSSTAYATQEMLAVLFAAGMGALAYAFPISIAIVILLAIVTLSYEQTIRAYEGGGGAYIVSRDNLGEVPAMVAGSSLLTDYVLTVAVSISSGVAQLVSAFPALFTYRVHIAIALVLFVMLVNLRGVREAGSAFAIPTYFFVVMMVVTVAIGLIRYFSGTLGTVVGPPEPIVVDTTRAVGIFLILHAFSSGTTAMTGVEAISNGITAFRPPKSHNAGITLIWMSGILGVLLVTITFLSVHIAAIPSEEETVISQIGRTVFDGRGIPYLLLIAATTVILIMAANTSYAGFPRLSALLAADGFLPRQLAFRGSRLVYSRGIVALAVIASILILVFRASVTSLIPLYAIGVFLSFTLSQAGMSRRSWKIGRIKPGETLQERGSVLSYDPTWKPRMLINGFGALCTFVVTIVFAITKFSEGAWVVLILIPLVVLVFNGIHRHYRHLARDLSLEHYGPPPPVTRHRVIIPVSGVHRGTVTALRYARLLSTDVTAVHVSVDAEETERLRRKWELWGEGVRLVILDSPYRLLAEPLLQYIEDIAAQRGPNESITIVVPRFVPRHWWNNFLHTQAAVWLQLALMFKPGIIITDVPYQVE